MGFGSFKFWNAWIFIYVHLYHVYMNISNLLEVVSMHKHCPNHFCILGFKMSIVVLIEKSCKLCSKTIFNPNFIFTSLKWHFPYIQMGMNHMCQSHTTLHSLTFEFEFDFCLTFSWIFIFFIKVCIMNTSLIIF